MLLSYFGRPPRDSASKTSPTDPVSDADREAERVIRELLLNERPEDGLVGEEGSRIEGRTARRWIVDPLDGTVNFLYGLRAWAVSIASRTRRGSRRAWCSTRWTASASPHCAVRAALNGRPIRVTSCPGLDRAMVATGFSYELTAAASRPSCSSALLPRIRDLRRAGAAALDLAYVAAGRVDAFYERGLKRWDEAAGRCW